ncbi:MAG TPA: NAD(P)/FAD-dependent oxidoreductase, partial [Kofleriaceae bacterium]|nr:NAD(P)/FAD-dependent oxidoreductase [Kofleriaceae bacterium]
VDVVVIGAGAVGLACGAVLARRGLAVVILERHTRIGQETSSRNSGVVHAGLYYPTGSLKAKLCVAGRELLYARCERDAIPHRRCGKVLVATDAAELAKLETIHAQARANGAGDVRMIDAAELARLEPAVRAIAGLVSPATGIVDAHGLMDSYRRQAEAHDAAVVLGQAVTALERRGEAWHVRAGDDELAARWVINAAGLDASRIAALAGLDIDALGYRQRPCKGDYFRLAPRHAGIARHLIYPVPVHAGLGVHITFDLDGKVTAGPDTEYIAELRYDIDPGKAAAFGAALRRYLPDVRDDDLAPDYAGIRPKLQGPGEPFRDFVIEEASRHGAPGLVNLLGIESPGLTASEAIAGVVASLIA